MRRVEIGSWPRCGIAAEHDVGRVNDQELRSPIPPSASVPPPLLVQCSLTRQSPIPPLIIFFSKHTRRPDGQSLFFARGDISIITLTPFRREKRKERTNVRDSSRGGGSVINRSRGRDGRTDRPATIRCRDRYLASPPPPPFRSFIVARVFSAEIFTARLDTLDLRNFCGLLKTLRRARRRRWFRSGRTADGRAPLR